MALQLESWLYDDLRKLMMQSAFVNPQQRPSLRAYIVDVLANHAQQQIYATANKFPAIAPTLQHGGVPLTLQEKCECGCCHAEDYGACDTYEQGMNGRCVYCDHSEACHGRDKERPMFNGPLEPGIREVRR
jgi:hypothetical protein